MTIVFNTDQKMAHEFWRKGLREGSVSLKLPTASDAKRFRFALYNSVRYIRSGKAFDEELLKAIQECSVTTEDSTVTVSLKSMSVAMLALTEQHGITAENLSTPKTAESMEMDASAARVLALLEAKEGNSTVATKHTSNRYYTRGE